MIFICVRDIAHTLLCNKRLKETSKSHSKEDKVFPHYSRARATNFVTSTLCNTITLAKLLEVK
jgi:hypothetical protein